jgi:hypothetical protein
MRHASLILAAGMLAASASTASAETLTSRIVGWNSTERIVTFVGERQMQVDTGAKTESLAPGAEVSVMFGPDANGRDVIYEVLNPGAYEGDSAQ